MKLREFIISLVVMVFLIIGIWRLWTFNNINNQKKTSSVSEPAPEVIVVEGDKQFRTISLSGTVDSWDGEEDVLVVLHENGEKGQYNIDPAQTDVSLVRSQNIYNDTKLFVINKSMQYMHWRQAFCKGDNVSLLIEQPSGSVKWVMNTGRRACGFKEDL